MSDPAILIASDHAGVALKQDLKRHLEQTGYHVDDMGMFDLSGGSVDYPDYAALVANKIASAGTLRGILICGTGIGMAIAANKITGVRAAVAWDEETARLSAEHNHCNILCLGARKVSPELARRMVQVWLDTEFASGRHRRRVEKIIALEKQP